MITSFLIDGDRLRRVEQRLGEFRGFDALGLDAGVFFLTADGDTRQLRSGLSLTLRGGGTGGGMQNSQNGERDRACAGATWHRSLRDFPSNS